MGAGVLKVGGARNQSGNLASSHNQRHCDTEPVLEHMYLLSLILTKGGGSGRVGREKTRLSDIGRQNGLA